MMKKFLWSAAFVFTLSTLVFAQNLSPEVKWQIERINLISKIAELENQVKALQLQIEYAKIRQDVEKANPGFTWDPKTGKFSPVGAPSVGDLR